jgi:hypothetical protein
MKTTSFETHSGQAILLFIFQQKPTNIASVPGLLKIAAPYKLFLLQYDLFTISEYIANVYSEFS